MSLKTVSTSQDLKALIVQNGDVFEFWTRTTSTSGVWKKIPVSSEAAARKIFDTYNNAFSVKETSVVKVPQKHTKKITSATPKSTKGVVSPVARFKEMFAEFGSTKSRAEMISMAVEAGINKGTASTYYYKLNKEL